MKAKKVKCEICGRQFGERDIQSIQHLDKGVWISARVCIKCYKEEVQK